jgi:hypothetical protein
MLAHGEYRPFGSVIALGDQLAGAPGNIVLIDLIHVVC